MPNIWSSTCLLRLLGWWSIDEESREEQARLYFDQGSGLVQFNLLNFQMKIVISHLLKIYMMQLQYLLWSSTWNSQENAEERACWGGISPFSLTCKYVVGSFLLSLLSSGINTQCCSSLFAFDLIRRQVWRLQAALGEQTEITKFSQQEYERLQNVMLSPLLLIITLFTRFSFQNRFFFDVVFPLDWILYFDALSVPGESAV